MNSLQEFYNLKKLNKCPICSSRNIIHKFNATDDYLHIVHNIFEMYFCKTCKVYFLNPLPDKEIIQTFYDFGENSLSRAYSKINPIITYTKLEKSLINKKNLTLFDRLYYSFLGIDHRITDLLTYIKLNKISFQKVLDVGCGAGYYTYQILLKFLQIDKKKIIGIDIHDNVEFFGNKLKIKMVKTKLEDYNEYGFDLISMSHVLEHIPNPRDLIKHVHKKLSNDGILYLCLPNGRSLPARIFGKKWICHNVPRHIYNFSKKSIIKITEDFFKLEFYSSGNLSTYMRKYYKLQLLKILFKNRPFKRICDTIFVLFNSIGDHQNFIFKKIIIQN